MIYIKVTMTTLTNKIRDCKLGVIENPYQSEDKKVLFVCSAGILRSATGARLYANKYNTRSAGTYDFALIKVDDTLMQWADEIVFVNKENYDMVKQRYTPETWELKFAPWVKVLDIPDMYEHMHPKLKEAFKEQYEDF